VVGDKPRHSCPHIGDQSHVDSEVQPLRRRLGGYQHEPETKTYDGGRAAV
jgi:hypothetical protein